MSKEYRLAVDTFPIDAHQLKSLAMTGFERAFHFRSYAAKMAYLERISTYYDAVAQQHGIQSALQ